MMHTTDPSGPRAAAAPTLAQLGVGKPQGTALIGAEGSEFVAGLLRTKGPNQAVQELHANYGLQHPLCRPLLHMLDYLDISRRDAHVYLLNRARKLLLDWVSSTHASTQQQRGAEQQQGDAPESREEIELQEKLERLLNASFKYMGVRELQQVPIEVMSCMSHVPAPYLKQLAEDREVFNELPAAVKQQVYEYDRNLLQQDAVQYIAAYKYELGTILAALNMSQFVRLRPRLCDKQPHSSAQQQQQQARSGGLARGAAALLPKPGKPGAHSSSRGARDSSSGVPAATGGFRIGSVLSAVSRDAQGTPPDREQQRQQQQQQQQRASPSSLPRVGGGFGDAPAAAAAASLLPSRRTVRSGSEAIKQLREMVGSSSKVYSHLVELCEVRLKESPSPYLGSKELSYCALRTQLLMALHDCSQRAGVGGAKAAAGGSRAERDFFSRVRESLPREGRCYDLVWLLDAALAQRRLSLSHMRKLAELLQEHIKPPARFLEEDEEHGSARQQHSDNSSGVLLPAKRPGAAAAAAAARGHASSALYRTVSGSVKRQRTSGSLGPQQGRNRAAVYDSDSDDAEEAAAAAGEQRDYDGLDAEDACGANAAHSQDKWLAEAGMVLRDPPAMHMLAAEVADTLHRCMLQRQLPCNVPQLSWLLRLMQLGVAARNSLRESRFVTPPHPARDLHGVWAELLVLLAEGEMEAQPWEQERQRPHRAAALGTDGQQQQQQRGWQLLVNEYRRQEVVRRVVQALLLDRLANADLLTARSLLQLLLDSKHLASPAAVPEYAPFAYSLASLLQELVKSRGLSARSAFWGAAVGEVLLALVDADSQVHIEVLRLLLGVCKELPPATLARYLGHMLAATAASRARASSQKKKFASISSAAASHAAFAHHGVPGYIAGGAASEWSDGFRTVRSLKYGGSSDGYSELYRKLVVVGGLSDKQELWPAELKQYMQELEERRQQEEAARHAQQQAARDDEQQAGDGDLF
uniref:Negative elongation factor B n=1 Tax=Tetradesmus obliquus TaxID=3088 RepID=A0A383VWM1_TETOB|eukprot:jgi/Sobl393_1/12997/SZX74265.1